MARDRIRAIALTPLVAWCSGALAVLAAGRHANAERFDPGSVTVPFGPLAYWDSVWFVAIARDGYERVEDAAFFPLYPLLVRAAGTLTGSEVVGGALVSVACLAGALVLLHRLVALDFGDEVAALTVLLVAAFPAAAFFAAVYSESLFLLLSVGAVLAARTDRWALAGATGMLACATRSAGIVLLVPLALLWWRSRPRRPRDLAWLGALPLGLAAFCALLAAGGRDALGPFRAQDAWGREFAGPFGGVVAGARAAWEGARQILAGEERTWPVYDTAWFDVGLLALLLVCLALLALALRRLPAAYSGYALAALALPLSVPAVGQPLMSLPRFVAVLWPLHLVAALALVDRPVARRAVVGISLAGLVLVSARLATWRWVA